MNDTSLLSKFLIFQLPYLWAPLVFLLTICQHPSVTVTILKKMYA